MAIYRFPVPELAEGASTIVDAGHRKLLVCRSGGELHATSIYCPHQHKPLEGARIRQGHIMCPHHGARFVLATGASASPLTPRALPIFPVSIADGVMTVDTSEH